MIHIKSRVFLLLLMSSFFSCYCLSYQYSINLIYISKTKAETDIKFLFEKFPDRMALPALNWARLNPNAEVNLWSDEDPELTPSKNIVNSKAKLEEMINSYGLKALRLRLKKQISFRNLRKNPWIKNNADLFTSDKSVWYRVDLARAMVADALLQESHRKIFVYADLDIKPFNLDAIVREVANHKRPYEYGFAMASHPGFIYENSFFIMAYSKVLLELHRKFVIEASMDVLRKMKSSRLGPSRDIVYNAYRLMFEKWMIDLGLQQDYLSTARDFVCEKANEPFATKPKECTSTFLSYFLNRNVSGGIQKTFILPSEKFGELIGEWEYISMPLVDVEGTTAKQISF
jgi:hypothetical protein